MLEFHLESGAGQQIPLVSHSRGLGVSRYFLGDETRGFGIADADVSLTAGAGVGARLTAVRVGEQDATLHLGVHHPDRGERQRLLRTLAQTLRYRPTAPLPRIVATEETGESFERPFAYKGGGSDIVDGQGDMSEVLLEVVHPHPYWRSRRPFEWRSEISSGGTLLPEFNLQQVVGSTTELDQLITNPGMVPVPISWVVTGPANGDITVHVGGRGWTFGPALAVDEVITVDVTAQGVTVTDHLGADRFADLTGTPEFPWLPEGAERVVMQMSGMVAGQSSVQGTVFPEFEVMHG